MVESSVPYYDPNDSHNDTSRSGNHYSNGESRETPLYEWNGWEKVYRTKKPYRYRPRNPQAPFIPSTSESALIDDTATSDMEVDSDGHAHGGGTQQTPEGDNQESPPSHINWDPAIPSTNSDSLGFTPVQETPSDDLGDRELSSPSTATMTPVMGSEPGAGGENLLSAHGQPRMETAASQQLQQQVKPSPRVADSNIQESLVGHSDSLGVPENFVDAAHHLSSQPSSPEKTGSQPVPHFDSGPGETSATGAARPRPHAQGFAGRILSFLEANTSQAGDRSRHVHPNSSMRGLRAAARQVVTTLPTRPPAYDVWGFRKSPPESGGDTSFPSGGR